MRAGEHEIEEIVVDDPDEHRGARGPRLEDEGCRAVGDLQTYLDDAVVAHALPDAPAPHQDQGAGEAEARARVAHQRRHHVVGADGALELGAEVDQALEAAPDCGAGWRSLTAEKSAAHSAKSRKVTALTIATRSSTKPASSITPASAAACATRSRCAHHSASLSPVRYDATSVTAMTSRNTRNRSGLRYRR